MSTSAFGGTVRFPAGALGGDEDPAHTQRVRDGLLNNALHMADSVGQVLVNMAGVPSGSVYEYWDTEGTPVVGVDQLILQVGPFPLLLREDGTPYQHRMRIAGTSSAGNGVTFRVVIAPPGEENTWRRSAVDWVHEVSTAQTSPAWLQGGTSQGALASPVLMAISASRAARWVQNASTIASAGGAATSVPQLLVNVSVFGETSNASSKARLVGLYVDEYVGDD